MSKFHPIWIALKPDFILSRYSEIYCDEARLKHHLIWKLSYNEDNANRVIKQITELLNKASALGDFWDEATKEGTSSEVVNVILQSIDHSQLITVLSYQDVGGYTALHWCAFN